MAEIRLKKGYNIPLAGAAKKELETAVAPSKVALLPFEFRGIKPKLSVKEGDTVQVGSPLFTDKQNPDIRFVSPVSGKVSAINRGERRKLMEIVVENDQKSDALKIGNWSKDSLGTLGVLEIKQALLKGGLWPHIMQRPFSIIANPEEMPRDIFISGFDTGPLASKIGFLLKDRLEDFQLGIDMLSKLTDGKIFLSIPKTDSFFSKIKGVEINVFSGPHPAGNVGVQMHHVKPLKRGEMVWQINAVAVALIGRFFSTGEFPVERIVALAGSSVKEPKYISTTAAAPLAHLIPESKLDEGEVRIVSGNVLTGRKSNLNSYLGFYDTLITVLPEGTKKRKLLGYFLPGFKTESYSRTFFSSLVPGKKEYALDTLLKGGPRAFVMSASDYEKVVPMDILPVQLAKSVLAEDIEDMEGLGILELDEEDVALCSYMCLSKTDFGKILRDGLDLIQKEG